MQKAFRAFREEVLSDKNKQKLFVMVVDEAHQAATRRGAHDAFVNDLMWRSGDGPPKHGAWPSGPSAGHVEVAGPLCQASNLVTLLVSATPACLLTGNSRIPRVYYLPKEPPPDTDAKAGVLGLCQFSIIRSCEFDPNRPDSLESIQWKFGEQDIAAADLKMLISQNVSFLVLLSLMSLLLLLMLLLSSPAVDVILSFLQNG